MFAKDGEVYSIDGKSVLVIGGAYSIDKEYRLMYGYKWFKDEQLTPKEMDDILTKVKGKHFDIVLTHTTPYKYEPREVFMTGLDQTKVDKSMEHFLDKIEDTIDYDKWYCGHYHTEKQIDKVEFMIITNVGDKAKPLSKIASGGEMSRIMLAIKNILADVDEVPIMVFDEIDTGISGNAANSVGDKMKLISKRHQVICITHQAAIAAKGDYNYFISKNVKDNRTSSKVKMLTEKETISEIARISSGSTSIAALNHAKELRERKLKLVI